MKVIVCIKQVPDTSGKVAVNPDGTLNRASMQTITNPDDMNAVEAALKLKDETGCEVIVVTMGPPPAAGMLREAMAMGADRAILVSAREFGGSDTYATSQILAAAIDTLGLEKDDIVMCGRQAIDGDTAQVGPQIGEKLHLPQITYAADIKVEGETVTVHTRSGKSYKDIDSVLIAGGFGAYMKIKSACAIGLLPPALMDKTRHVGNSAGKGAAMALTAEGRALLSTIAEKCSYEELSSSPLFNDKYIEAMMFEEWEEVL